MNVPWMSEEHCCVLHNAAVFTYWGHSGLMDVTLTDGETKVIDSGPYKKTSSKSKVIFFPATTVCFAEASLTSTSILFHHGWKKRVNVLALHVFQTVVWFYQGLKIIVHYCVVSWQASCYALDINELSHLFLWLRWLAGFEGQDICDGRLEFVQIKVAWQQDSSDLNTETLFIHLPMSQCSETKLRSTCLSRC